VLPAAAAAFVLFFEVAHQRLEVVDDGTGVHFLCTRQFFQRLRPWLAGSRFEHGRQAVTGFLAAVDRAGVQFAFVAGGVAKRALELKLQDACEEVARVGNVARNVIFRTRIKIGLAAFNRCGDALVTFA